MNSSLLLADLSAPMNREWIAVVMSYLLGAIPFGWLFARLRGIDLRAVGSGNIGATNASRALGKPLGLLAFVCDFGKGWFPAAILAERFASGPESVASLAVACGAAAAVGHCYPATLGFRGGKAVSTWCGAVVGIDPLVFVFGGLVWLATVFTLRFVGLASMLMAAAFPIIAWARHGADAPLVAGGAAMAVLIALRHRANIGRMLSGNEARFGSKKRSADGQT